MRMGDAGYSGQPFADRVKDLIACTAVPAEKLKSFGRLFLRGAIFFRAHESDTKQS